MLLSCFERMVKRTMVMTILGIESRCCKMPELDDNKDDFAYSKFDLTIPAMYTFNEKHIANAINILGYDIKTLTKNSALSVAQSCITDSYMDTYGLSKDCDDDCEIATNHLNISYTEREEVWTLEDAIRTANNQYNIAPFMFKTFPGIIIDPDQSYINYLDRVYNSTILNEWRKCYKYLDDYDEEEENLEEDEEG